MTINTTKITNEKLYINLQLQTSITSKIFELETCNFAQITALENILAMVPLPVILLDDLIVSSKRKEGTRNNYN